MKIIIAGAGEVGYHIAKLLSKESQDTTVIDINKEKLSHIQEKLDVFTLRGDATSFDTLREAQIENADIFIAVTELQNTNLVSALIAKKLGVKKTIARVNNPEYLQRSNAVPIQRMGIDVIISPEELAAKEIVGLLEESVFNESHSFDDGLLKMVGVKVDEKALIIDKSVKEISDKYNSQLNFMPIALIKHEDNSSQKKVIIPRGESIYEANDEIFFVTTKDGKKSITGLLGKQEQNLKNIIILGGGRIGKKTARMLLKSNHSVKIIEREQNKAEELAEEFPKAMIINGDGRDGELLDEEGIAQCDAFVAVTGRSETNIMSCILAKSKGVKKTVSVVENIHYINLSKEAGINAFINKKLLAADAIFRYVRKGKVLDLAHLSDYDAEIMEFKVDDKCKLYNNAIKNLNFPKEAIIAGIVRRNKPYIPTPDFVIEENDKVLIFSLPEAIPKIEKLFSRGFIHNLFS